MSDSDSGEREMTLDEWCCRLPDGHKVNKELRELRERAMDVPDICWDYDNQEDGVYPDEMAVRLSDNLQTGESETFAVSCAKILTNRAISVSVSHEGEVTWEWEWDKLPEKDDEF
jgi:hypothetical protein